MSLIKKRIAGDLLAIVPTLYKWGCYYSKLQKSN